MFMGITLVSISLRDASVGQRRSEGVRAAVARGGKRAKIVFKNSRENSDCIISYVFACNKNRALQLQRVPILSMGYTIGS